MKPSLTLCAAMLALAFAPAHAAPAAAAATAPPSAESFFQPADMQSVKLSPSGRWMAVQGSDPGGRVKLSMIDLEGKEPKKIIAMFSKFDVASFLWVSEDWLVFSVVDHNDQSGKSYGDGLMSVRRDGEKMRQLIKRSWESGFPNNAEGVVALEPNHHMIGLSAPGTNEIVIGEDNYGVDWKEYEYTSVRVMNVATGATRSMFKDSPAPPEKMSSWLIDALGQPRAAVARKDNKKIVYWREPSTKAWRKIAEMELLKQTFALSYVDDKDQLFVTALNAQTGMDELRKFDFGTGMPEEEPVIDVPGFDADPSPIKDPGSNKVHGLQVLSDAESTVWFTPAMDALQKRVDTMLPGMANLLFCHPCEKPNTVLIYSYSDTNPGEYLLYKAKDDSFARIGPRRRNHQEAQMANVELLRAKTRDGADLPIWITRTNPAQTAPRPAVVLVHGGPWSRGSEWHWNDEAQFLATRGYVVIEPEFRGSTGFGDKHFRAGWKQWGMRMQDDVTDALRHAVAKGMVDPKRVCIAGASYGGYATLMGLARDQDRDQYRCGVAWVGVTDPRYMFSVHWSDIGATSKKYSMPSMIGDPVKDADMLAANAPIALAGKIKAPVLLAYGAKDRRVPLVHGEDMRAALTAAGRPPEWIVYDDEGHGFSRPANNIDFWKRVEAFLAKNLK
jgi:acetyl esterase/lipase